MRWPILTIIGGISCSLLIILFFRLLSNTYATFLTLVLIGPFVFFIVREAKLVLLAILIVCLPITVDITIGHTGHLSGAAGYVISAYDIVLAALYILWMAEIVRKKNIKINFFPQVSIPAIFLFGIASISMIFASYPNLSKFELIEMFKMYLSFLYLANNIKSKKEVQFIIAFLMLGLSFEGLLGFAQHRYSEPFFPTALGGPHGIDSRISGTWGSYNDFAWYLTFMLPIALSMLFSEIKPVYKLICSFSLIIGGSSLLWTNSRGGWISFAVGALFVGLFVFPKIKGKTGLIKTFATIVAILIFISPLYPRLLAKFHDRVTSYDRGAAQSRLPQFEVAYSIIMDNPISGVGLNNYTEVMHDYDITEEGLETITPHAVHNIYLHIAAELGIFGIAVFIWFLTAIYIEGIRYALTNKGVMTYAVIGMVAGILAFLVHGLVDTASLGNKLLLFVWFFAGVIFAISKKQIENNA